ncbi:hypothetical protein ASG11_17855 [Sphingomonas sp. Leaf357]|uniref:PEPxxWA-CTERM sorting domain-containing protein n=1 Tax=Sphingomonas sp. Leaf357 TaxID=1736350 RepID=UPI000700B0E9|nr:PEPxxWA-CTERM sorting domain-containing protein [Sphingomonas sp. Leaf357]KQS01519.1 hypothetical protein ASG11_17855 [Sphingomonas sp. Leaf357]
MKIGLTIAAIAVSFISTAASAVDFVSYAASGTGYRVATNSLYGEIAPRELFSFTFSFALPAGGTGFTPLFPYQTYSFGSPSSGVINFSQLVISGSFSSVLNGTINYNDADQLNGFPTALANNDATGSFSFRAGDPFSNRYGLMFGQFDSFQITGSGDLMTPVILATSPLPETATWAMMIAGFGMMGAAMRTRRRSTKVSFA